MLSGDSAPTRARWCMDSWSAWPYAQMMLVLPVAETPYGLAETSRVIVSVTPLALTTHDAASRPVEDCTRMRKHHVP